jgi:hypothetical protein
MLKFLTIRVRRRKQRKGEKERRKKESNIKKERREKKT